MPPFVVVVKGEKGSAPWRVVTSRGISFLVEPKPPKCPSFVFSSNSQSHLSDFLRCPIPLTAASTLVWRLNAQFQLWIICESLGRDESKQRSCWHVKTTLNVPSLFVLGALRAPAQSSFFHSREDVFKRWFGRCGAFQYNHSSLGVNNGPQKVSGKHQHEKAVDAL